MTILVTVLALHTAPVLGLVAVTAVVTLGVAVAAALDARLGALGDVVAWLKAVEAGTTSATTTSTRLEGLGAVGLAVAGR